MKKIPTLFKRVFSPDHKTKTILPEVTPGCEAVLEGRCIPTVKWDGACCAIINGEIYKRYDAKVGKNGKRKMPPEGAIPCQPEPDPITGHWPHWVKCEEDKPEDKYFLEAFAWGQRNMRKTLVSGIERIGDGTFEAVGPAWQSNPYVFTENRLIRHGVDDIRELEEQIGFPIDIGKERSSDELFKILSDYLESHIIEGIVFWKDGAPFCKIKRSDFGFSWPPRKGE